jgi:hypothetical protein
MWALTGARITAGSVLIHVVAVTSSMPAAVLHHHNFDFG